MSQLVISEVGDRGAMRSVQGDAGREPDPADRIEVRLLGPLQVRRADGSLVHPQEWRTGKTVDLLRLLATRAGEAVSVDEILEALWPQVDEQRGRGSLRNALGHLRKLLGQGAIERRPDGLVLRGAWVDSAALLALADEARRHARHGRLALAVKVAREADALHLGEFTTHDPDALWAVPVRENLESRFREMTLDAAEHAVELGWMRDGLELGQRALEADATSERAYRVLMRAYTGLGETERALRVYERCRAVLAEDLGLDPSPQTRALHLEILSSEPHDAPPAPFTGRDRELRSLLGWLSQRRSTGGPGLVYVSGAGGLRAHPPGAGGRCSGSGPGSRSSAAPTTRSRPSRPPPRPSGAARTTPRAGRRRSAGRSGVIVLVTATAHLTPAVAALAARRARRRRRRRDRGPAAVRQRPCGTQAHDEAEPGRRRRPPDSRPSPSTCCPSRPPPSSGSRRRSCAAPRARACSTSSRVRSEGLPGRALATIDAWCRAGEVAATSQGLALVPPHDPSNHGTEQSTLLVRAMEQTGARDQHVLHLVAVLDRPVSPALLMPLLRGAGARPRRGRSPTTSPRSSRRWTASSTSSCWRAPPTATSCATPSCATPWSPGCAPACDAACTPTSPSGPASPPPSAAGTGAPRARSSSPPPPPSTPCATRWRPETSPPPACSCSSSTTSPSASHALGADLAELEESLADVCLAAGRVDEAVQHYGRAADWLDDTASPAAERLRDKAARAQRSLAQAAHDAQPEADSAPAPDVPPEPDDEARERAAWAAVLEADTAGRSGAARRHQVAPGARAPAALTPPRPGPRGHGRGHRPRRRRARRGPPPCRCTTCRTCCSATPGSPSARWMPPGPGSDPERPEVGHLAVLRCLVGHDLGRRGFDDPLGAGDDAGATRTPSRSSGPGHGCGCSPSAARSPRRSRRTADRSGPTRARWAASCGRCRPPACTRRWGARPTPCRVLREAMSEAEEEGCSLLLPEVTARMVVLTAPTDPDEAIGLFELFDWAVGSEIGHAREGYLRLLARAAVRAGHHELDRAAAAAANAARIAQDSGLVLLASEAYLAQAQYLFEGGWSAGARVATAGAARCLRAAGTVG